jgi:hypothetical protein
MRRRGLMAAGLAGMAAAGVSAGATPAAATGATPGRRPVVLELFTSQGCSSCPPADALLHELARSRADVLPLAFHVTYWDRLGWPDRFALAAATARQRGYARISGAGTIYTPQMVVDGVVDVVGSDRPRVLAAIAAAALRAREGALSVAVTRDRDGLAVALGDGTGSGQVLLVGFDPEHRTPVGRGENAGRVLVEANIVRSVTELGPWSGVAWSLRAAVPAGERHAVLVQAADGRMLGAAVAG